MAPVSACHLVLCLQFPVSVVVRGSSISCHSWLQYLLSSFMAPVSPVLRGSSICRLVLWLQYMSSPAVARPVSVVCRRRLSSGSSRQPSSVLATCLTNRVLFLYLSKYRQITTTEWWLVCF